jgi:uncharacterized membrane protein YdjX (TVP38/TMEM64 family)
VHRPDLPLYPGGAVRLGFGLWNSPIATVVVEGIVFIVGVTMYARGTQPSDRIGRWSFWGLVAFLILLYVVSSVSPPPTSVRALAWGALIGWPLTLWPWWVDRHRQSLTPHRGM